MLQRLAAPFSKLSALIGRNLCLGVPPRAPVLVFYLEGGDFISRHVLADLPHAVLDVRRGRLPLDPRLALRLTAEILRQAAKRLRVAGPRGLIRHMLGEIRTAYLGALIADCRPAAVLTFIDNSALFHKLSQRFPATRWISIQNGVRTDRSAEDIRRQLLAMEAEPVIEHLYALGPQSVEVYQRNGLTVRHPVIAGSLRADVQVDLAGEAPPVTFDLCLVSHWKAQFYQAGQTPEVIRYNDVRAGAVDTLNGFLLRYREERDVSLAIAARTTAPEEADFYRRTFGDGPVFFPRDAEGLSSYDAVRRARLSVGMYSTLMYEAMALGRRAVIMNLLDDRQLDPPRDGLWSLTLGQHDYPSFRDRLDRILSLDDEEYQRQCRTFTEYMVLHDATRPTHKLLRQAVLDSLAPPV